jgi:hypothetical protein
MTSGQLFRIGGFALLAGASLFVGHVILRSVITSGPDPAVVATGRLWVPVNVVGLVGAVLVLIGLPAVAAGVAGAARPRAILGVALLEVAWMFFGLFLSLYSLLLMPWLAEKAPALVAASASLPPALVGAFLVGIFAWFVGAVLLAIPFLRRDLRPSWVGYVLLASAVWMVIGNLILAPSGPASNVALNLLSNLGPVILMVGLGYLGYQIGSQRSRARA